MLDLKSGQVTHHPKGNLAHRAYQFISSTKCMVGENNVDYIFTFARDEIVLLEVRADEHLVYSVFFRNAIGQYYDITRDILGIPHFHSCGQIKRKEKNNAQD